MTDEAIRDLEREVSAAPDDASLRLKLVRALARARRGREALERLDTTRVPRDLLAGVASLAAELWLEELSGLERRKTFEVDGLRHVAFAEPLLAWVGAKGLAVVDVATGDPVHRAEGDLRAGGVVAANGRVFALDPVRHRLTCVEASGAASVLHQAPAILHVSPGGDKLLFWDERVARVEAWPGLAPIFERRIHGRPAIDWEAGQLVALNSVGLVEVLPLQGGFPTLLEIGANEVLNLVGHGAVADRSAGITLKALRGGWKLELFRAEGTVPAASVSGDGRGVRVLLGDRVVRFEVDLARGKLLAAPPALPLPGAGKKGRDPEDEPPLLWHPHADVVLRGGRGGTFDLLGPGGVLRAKLAGSPVRWSRDGLSLVLVQEGRTPGLEVWSGARPA
jgi:hypothetical protein